MIHDCVIIGTSPLCITEAYCRASAGQKVAIVERKGHIGGAWATIDANGFSDVEYGTHILFPPDPSVYSFLSDCLDWDLVPMQPPPEVIAAGRRVRYSPQTQLLANVWSNWDKLLHGRNVDDGIQRDRWARWYDNKFRPLRNCIRDGIKYLLKPGHKPDYLYPVGGAPAIMSTYRQQLTSAGVEIRLQTVLNGIQQFPTRCL